MNDNRIGRQLIFKCVWFVFVCLFVLVNINGMYYPSEDLPDGQGWYVVKLLGLFLGYVIKN